MGDLDPSPDLELGIAGSHGALLLGENGQEVAVVRFDTSAGHVDIVDVTGDGECEFMNRGGGWQPVSLFDHRGELVWSYAPTAGANDLAAGDLDGDGTLEFVVGCNGDGGVHLLDKDGQELWEKPDRNVWHVEVIDSNGDGQKEIVHTNGSGQIVVRDGDGEILQMTRPQVGLDKFSLFQSDYPITWAGRAIGIRLMVRDRDGKFVPQTRPPVSLDRHLEGDYMIAWAASDRRIRLIDFEGRVSVERFAPRSVRVFDTWGTPVRLRENGAVYLAVLLQLRTRWHRSILYLYDPEGTIVFQDVLDETARAVAALPTATPGNQRLLVGGEGRVWEYTFPGNVDQGSPQTPRIGQFEALERTISAQPTCR